MFASRLLRNAVASASTASAVSSLRTKQSTYLTGLAVHPTPLAAIHEVYSQTLHLLQALPKESVYRQATEALTTARLQKLESAKGPAQQGETEEAILAFENAVDDGQAEEILVQAKAEKSLVERLIEDKPYEPLEHPAPEGQWRYFNMNAANGEGQQ